MTGFDSFGSDNWRRHRIPLTSSKPPRSLRGNRSWLNLCQPLPMLQRSSAQKWSSCWVAEHWLKMVFKLHLMFVICLFGLWIDMILLAAIKFWFGWMHERNNQKQLSGKLEDDTSLSAWTLQLCFPDSLVAMCQIPSNSTMDFLHIDIWKRRTSCTFACSSLSCFLVSPESWILSYCAGLDSPREAGDVEGLRWYLLKRILQLITYCN